MSECPLVLYEESTQENAIARAHALHTSGHGEIGGDEQLQHGGVSHVWGVRRRGGACVCAVCARRHVECCAGSFPRLRACVMPGHQEAKSGVCVWADAFGMLDDVSEPGFVYEDV